jgi:hypothetical protein
MSDHCADTARPPGQPMSCKSPSHTNTGMQSKSYKFCLSDRPQTVTVLSLVHTTLSQESLRDFWYYIHEEQVSNATHIALPSTPFVKVRRARNTSESPFNASLHDISELPLFGIPGSIMSFDTASNEICPMMQSHQSRNPGGALVVQQSSTDTSLTSPQLVAIKPSKITFLSAPLKGKMIRYSESPPNASLHDISELPLFGTPGSIIPFDAHVLYITTTIRPLRNPAGAFKPSSTDTSPLPRPCQARPQLVPVNQCNWSTRRLSFCNECVYCRYGVRGNPGEQIQKHMTLDIRHWKFCNFLTATWDTSRSYLNKSLVHCWRRATGRVLTWSLCDV